MTLKFERPELPYQDKKLPNNDRFKIWTLANKALTYTLLDGEANYNIDSLNELGAAISAVDADLLTGSNVPANAGRFPTTNGDEDNPIISWTNINSANIADNAIEKQHILPSSVTEEKIQNEAITNEKIDTNTITVDRIKYSEGDPSKKAKYHKDWANKIGSVSSTKSSLVARSEDGEIKVDKLDAKAIKVEDLDVKNLKSPTFIALEKKVNDIISTGLQKVIDDAFEKEHPLYSYNFNNPRQGDKINGRTIGWSRLGSGYILASSGAAASQEDGRKGNTPLTGADGKTESHKLTTAEMPSHAHSIAGYEFTAEAGVSWKNRGVFNKDFPNASTITSSTGGNGSHSHAIDAMRIELPLYKRIS